MWDALISLALKLVGLFFNRDKPQPDAHAEDQRVEEAKAATQAETINTANTATQEAKEADRAKDDAAATAVADGRAERVRDPSSVHTSPDAHFRD